MNRRKIVRIVFFSLITLGFLLLHFYVPRFITEIRNPIIGIVKQNSILTIHPLFEHNRLNGKYISFKSFDGLELSSYLTYSSSDTAKGTIILLHGIRSKKEHFISLSNKLSKIGYNTVALDARAHGESEGRHCTFGVKEKQDVSELITILLNQEYVNENIGVWGQSLGGAIGLQALGTDTRIKFGIIESTFTDFRTITNDYISFHLGFAIKPLTDYLVYRAGKIADFDPDEAKPIRYCENIDQPILIVHGNKDERINICYGKENYSKIPSTEKVFLEVENASHLNVWDIGGDEYFENIMKFIERHSD